MRRQAVRRRRPEGWAAWMLAVVVTVCGLLNAPSAAAQASVTTAEPEWRQDLDAWRARRAQEIASPDGWLTLAGLEWLQSGANSIGSAADNSLPLHAKVPEHIGLLVVSGGAVQLLPTVGGFPPDLTIDGQPARRIRKGAAEAMKVFVDKEGGLFPKLVSDAVYDAADQQSVETQPDGPQQQSAAIQPPRQPESVPQQWCWSGGAGTFGDQPGADITTGE